MRVLIVGCGAIGSFLAKGLASHAPIEAVLLLDLDDARVETLMREHPRCRRAADLDAGIADADLVIEAAGQGAVPEVASRALEAGRDVVLLSVGAFADDALKARLESLAEAHGGRIHVPSGAVAGIDALRAAKEAGLRRVTLTTAKPPEGFGLGHEEIHDAVVLYEGSARAAVQRFPKNVNVAAVLSLAGLGFDDTEVRVVADPSLRRNTHHIEAEGDFGVIDIRVENEPSTENPGTSVLAAASALALVKGLAAPVRIGT